MNIDSILKDNFKKDMKKKDFYLSVNWKNSYKDIKLSLFEKIKIALHPFKNPYSPFVYPIRRKINYYYNNRLLNDINLINDFKKFYLSNIDLTNKDIKILDYGCGDGRIIAIMNKLGFYNIVGQDVLYFNYWKKLKCNFIKIPIGYSDFYPYKDKTFDLIFSFQVRMYLNQTLLKQHIENISRIIKDEGYFIFEDRNENLLNPKYYTSNECCPYIHKRELLIKLLENNGFEIINEKTYGIGVKYFPTFISILRNLIVKKTNFDIFDYKPKSWFDKLLLKMVPKGKETLHLLICKKSKKI